MKAVATIFILLILAACTTKLYVPSDVNAGKRVPATLAELQQGHDLFSAKCGKCHGYKKPGSHSPEQWTKVLQKMGPKAKLTNEQTSLVFKYLANY